MKDEWAAAMIYSPLFAGPCLASVKSRARIHLIYYALHGVVLPNLLGVKYSVGVELFQLCVLLLFGPRWWRSRT